MPKKDTSSAVLGMLSNAGSRTRPADGSAPTPVSEALPATPSKTDVAAPKPATAMRRPERSPQPPAPETVATPETAGADTAPRTLRLRAGTASALRDAWLEAKRDAVLLTAQDFASNLIDEALTARARRQRSERPS